MTSMPACLIHVMRMDFGRLHAQVWHHPSHTFESPGGLHEVHTFFFNNPLEFDEIVQFVTSTAAEHGMPLRILHGGFKQGLESLLSSTPIQAIILGTRQ